MSMYEEQEVMSVESHNRIVESLRRQLTDSQKREVMLREVIERNIERMHFAEPWSAAESDIEFSRKALSASADLKDVRLCHAEPVRYIYEFKNYKGRSILSSNLEHNGQVPTATIPLYREWKPK